MAGFRHITLVVWSARELQRQPGRCLLLFACLTALVFVTATPLLFCQALDVTWAHLLDRSPDLVIRRIDAGGWVPLPAAEAAARAKAVPGVIEPIPRIWGVVAGPSGPVTLVTAVPQAASLIGIQTPGKGLAVVGRGVLGDTPDRHLFLGSRHRIRLKIVDTFPAESSLATHDLVWVSEQDARQLLGLAPGQASDLAVYLNRPEEEKAIQADLAEAFPWPVHITDRSTTAHRHHHRALRYGGIAVLVGTPAILALLLILIGVAAGGQDQQYNWALLNAMGWTSADVARLQTTKAMIVGLPAVFLGLSAAYAAVFLPFAAGLTAHWITGGRHLPVLTLDQQGALLTMLEIAAIVGVPYLATTFIAGVRGAQGAFLTFPRENPWC